MPIAGLWNVPSSDEEISLWGFTHLAHHRDVDAQIFRQYGVKIEEFVIDPFSPDNPGEWARQHQAMHNAVNLVINNSGFDLTRVNWKKPALLAGWIQSNAFEHRVWSNILGVG